MGWESQSLGRLTPVGSLDLPRLLKILDVVKNPNISLVMYGVDTKKDEGSGLSRKYNIERVPSIIFLKGDRELGRIVENPNGTMETDICAIVGAK